jgi:hypothetical protein
MKSAEAAIAAALPQGITPEELAALAAAANAFAGATENRESNPAEAEASLAANPETPVVEKAESASPEVAAAVTFASAPVVDGELTPEARKQDLQTPAQAAELQRATTDAEVLAALASLSPTNIEAADSAGTNGDRTGAHHQEQASASAVASSGVRTTQAGASGPRWIAQSVAIADDESTLILEREMEKAYAAMAALEAENTSAPAGEMNASAVAGAETVASSAGATHFAPEIAASSGLEPSPQPEPEQAAQAAEAQGTSGAGMVSEESGPEARTASEEFSAAAENVNAVSETSVPVVNENAAYAAAASAGSGAPESSSQAENTSMVEASGAEQIDAAPAGTDSGKESELAAAWQNWKQIRESILGSPLPKDVAQAAAAAGFEQVRREESATAQPAEDGSSEGAPSESAAIANIVDSVLAELKPKLMEEIRKKMKKDKKR